MPPWTPSFGTYHAWIGNSPVFVTVDQAAIAGIGLDHPFSFSFMMELHEPREDGLISAEERPRVDALEDAVEAWLGEHGEPWRVGNRTELGKRFVFYYMPKLPERSNARQEWPHGYKLRFHAAPDPGWTEYRESLAPTPFQELLIDNNRTLWEMRKLGSDPAVSRVVAHYALFADRASAVAGAADLEAAGFTVGEITDGVVACTKTHDLQAMTLEHVIATLLAAVEPRGGRYDGWGAPLHPDQPPPQSRPRRR
jgi:hypothetical protein